MPIGSGVQIQGDEKLMRKLRHLETAALKRVIRPSARSAASVINKSAKANAKAVSKAVSDSIGVKAKTYAKSDTVWVGIGPRKGRKYWVKRPGMYWGNQKIMKPHKVAHLLEYGTDPHEIPGVGMHPGTAPQPFLRPAWDESQTAAWQTMRAKAWFYLKKEAMFA